MGSPIAESEKELTALGKKLKKNSVAVDVVAFGVEANIPKLEPGGRLGDGEGGFVKEGFMGPIKSSRTKSGGTPRTQSRGGGRVGDL